MRFYRNEEKRSNYDKYGEKGAEEVVGVDHGYIHDILIYLVGWKSGGGAQRRRKGEDVGFPFKVELQKFKRPQKTQTYKILSANHAKGRSFVHWFSPFSSRAHL